MHTYTHIQITIKESFLVLILDIIYIYIYIYIHLFILFFSNTSGRISIQYSWLWLDCCWLYSWRLKGCDIVTREVYKFTRGSLHGKAVSSHWCGNNNPLYVTILLMTRWWCRALIKFHNTFSYCKYPSVIGSRHGVNSVKNGIGIFQFDVECELSRIDKMELTPCLIGSSIYC